MLLLRQMAPSLPEIQSIQWSPWRQKHRNQQRPSHPSSQSRHSVTVLQLPLRRLLPWLRLRLLSQAIPYHLWSRSCPVTRSCHLHPDYQLFQSCQCRLLLPLIQSSLLSPIGRQLQSFQSPQGHPSHRCHHCSLRLPKRHSPRWIPSRPRSLWLRSIQSDPSFQTSLLRPLPRMSPWYHYFLSLQSHRFRPTLLCFRSHLLRQTGPSFPPFPSFPTIPSLPSFPWRPYRR